MNLNISSPGEEGLYQRVETDESFENKTKS